MSRHKAHSHSTNTPSPVAGHRAATRASSSSHPRTCAQLTHTPYPIPDTQLAIRSLADAHARLSRYDDDRRDYLDPENPSWGPDVYAYRAGSLVRLLEDLTYHMRLRPELMEAVEDAWFNGGFVWRRLEADLQALGF